MVARSYLSASDVAAINRERRNLLATSIAMQEINSAIVLYRLNPATNLAEPLAAQTVLISYAGSWTGGQSTESSAVQTAAGAFRKELPFDVKVGDAFDLPSGQHGQITAVPMAKGGIQRALLTVDEGMP